MKNLLVTMISLLPYSTAFSFPALKRSHHRTLVAPQKSSLLCNSGAGVEEDSLFDPLHLSAPAWSQMPSLGALTAASLILILPDVAGAAEPDWGLFEGRTGSLIHPIAMGGLFLMSLSTGIKGWQYRTQRTIPDEIAELKKTLPNLRGAASVRDALLVAEKEEQVNAQLVQSLKAAMPIQEQIDSLSLQRKDLISQNVRDNHFSSGALLAFLGTALAIEGPLNTYARAGKLFPGPHLYAGAALVVLWAAAVACIPGTYILNIFGYNFCILIRKIQKYQTLSYFISQPCKRVMIRPEPCILQQMSSELHFSLGKLLLDYPFCLKSLRKLHGLRRRVYKVRIFNNSQHGNCIYILWYKMNLV